MKKENGFGMKAIVIIIFITAIVTSLTTGVILFNNTKLLLGNTRIKTDEALQEFLKVYNGLDSDYYSDINKTEMIDAAISAMLDYLGEDYSTYLNQNETEDLAARLSGKFLGIGISIKSGNQIVRVYEGSPAYKAGILENDTIISINDTNTEKLNQVEVANLIDKVNENTIVIKRNEEIFTVKVTAENINSPIPYQIFEENNQIIGYISIDIFTNTVGEEFKKSLLELEAKNIDSLIIDVRNNTGGYLKGATEIASLFLEKGKTIYSLEGKETTEIYYDETEEARHYPVAIIMNDGTASASEILASALKDSYGAILVGQISYGKGKVQQTKTLEDGSMVKYTTAKWLRPNGECIDGLGIIPDYQVEIIEDEEGNYTDTQFEKAKEILYK